MKRHNQETERQMLVFFASLDEKGKRHYAAQSAQNIGYGGKRYIANLFGISEARIRRGEAELTNVALYAQIPVGKQRRVGGGRKKKSRPILK